MKIIKDGNPVFSAEIRDKRVYAIDYNKRADAMNEDAGRVAAILHQVGAIIAETRPVQLPMGWSIYPERIWTYNVEPVVTILKGATSWCDLEYVLDDGSGNRPIREITKAAVVIHVTCSPCWEAYRRWSSIIIEDFYRAARAVRDPFDIKWEDISKTQDVTWGEIEFRYVSKKPISTIRTDIPSCERYGEYITERVTEVRIQFSLTIPNFPDDQKNAANCHVIEEEVTTTSTKKVKRLRCE